MPDESQIVGDAAARGTLGDLDDLLEENGNDWQRVRPRKIHAEQVARLEEHTREIFETLGMDLSSPGTARTPRRFIQALIDATEGYEGDPGLITAFPTECRGGPDCHIGQVIEVPIPFTSGRPTTSSRPWPMHSTACAAISSAQLSRRWWWSPRGVTSTRGIPGSKDHRSS